MVWHKIGERRKKYLRIVWLKYFCMPCRAASCSEGEVGSKWEGVGERGVTGGQLHWWSSRNFYFKVSKVIITRFRLGEIRKWNNYWSFIRRKGVLCILLYSRFWTPVRIQSVGSTLEGDMLWYHCPDPDSFCIHRHFIFQKAKSTWWDNTNINTVNVFGI